MCSGFRSHTLRLPSHCTTRTKSSKINSDFKETEDASKTVSVEEKSDALVQDKKLFDMNQRVRLGRSKDQEGKSNIWSVEPTMEVEGEESESQVKKNLLVGVVVIGAAIATLPLFLAFSKLLPGAKH